MDKQKRTVSVLVPYKRKNNEIVVYIQKRAKDAKRLPDWFGFWGGGSEGNETPEETLLREIKEELDYTVKEYHYAGAYDVPDQLYHVFYTEVDDTFERDIKILEGEYGKWFTEQEVASHKTLLPADKNILHTLFPMLT